MARMEQAGDRVIAVAGLVVESGCVLLSQRTAHQTYPNQWEFPGGKVEPGESPQDALVREMREELGVRVEVGRIWHVLSHVYSSYDLMLLVYLCRLARGEQPQCVQVQAIAWCPREALWMYDILSADDILVARLVREGIPQCTIV